MEPDSVLSPFHVILTLSILTQPHEGRCTIITIQNTEWLTNRGTEGSSNLPNFTWLGFKSKWCWLQSPCSLPSCLEKQVGHADAVKTYLEEDQPTTQSGG